MSHRVLIVSPHFPPVNAPDHQRVRMSLPYFHEFGWEPHVLAVHPEYVQGILDPQLTETLPLGIPITRVPALPVLISRWIGLGSLGLRSWRSLKVEGNRLLRSGNFDLVFFSTTQFPVLTLGPQWKRRWGVPYVADFQDPWWGDYHEKLGAPPPPGGRFKYALSQFLARRAEPRVLHQASHVISVSPAYPPMWQRRYSWLKNIPITVLPFGAPENDFDSGVLDKVRQEWFSKSDGKRHWVYVGRGGKDMSLAVGAFCCALQAARKQDPQTWNRLKIHFIGTDYASDGHAVKSIAPVAADYGVADLVDEHPQRIPYFEALACLRDAEALIVPGSDDPGYTASKIYPYLLAHKPLLAIFHQTSDVVRILSETGGGTVVTFGGDDSVSALAERITTRWFQRWPPPESVVDPSAFQLFTAREMTRRLCRIFENCVSS